MAETDREDGVIVIPPGGGEVLGDSPQRRVEALSDRDELHATWSRFAAHREGAGLHIHRRHTDLFYVLEGELTVRLGIEDDEVAVPAGALARVPPMVVHGFRNASDAEVKYLNFHAPGAGFVDYMRGIRDGVKVDFDVDEPDVDGLLPASEAVVGSGEVIAEEDGRLVTSLAEVDAISVAEVRCAAEDLVEPTADSVVSRYLIEGKATVELGDGEVEAVAGSWVQTPPGVSARWTCAAPARYLRIETPLSRRSRPR